MFGYSEQMMFQCPPRPMPMERKWTTKVEMAPNCPRCASSNTKFCYYNNYSLSQPRYFCKGCRRYWTKGGSLRNVPVGGGCRKYRRAKSSRVSRSEPAVSFNYGRNSNAFDTDTDGSSSAGGACSTTNLEDSSVSQQSGAAGNGSDIDLAVVFAKFLNQNPSREHKTILAEEQLSSKADELADVYNIPLTQLGAQIDDMTECQKLSSLMQEFDLLEEQSQVQLLGQKELEGASVQEFIASDMNSFGLQTLLSDQVLQDALWVDDVTTMPMLQLQGLDPFSLDIDHHLEIPDNSNSSKNSSSLDFSELGGFSRP